MTTSRPGLDEVEPLLYPQTSEVLNRNKGRTLSTYLQYAAQGVLAIGGATAGALYLGPGRICASTESCGGWLTKYVGEGFSVAIFTAGGLDFSIISAYFASISVTTFISSLKKHDSYIARTLKGAAIIVYAGTQNIPTFLVSMTTHSAPWETALSVAGNVPGSLYGGTGFADNEIPFLFSKLKRGMVLLRRSVVDCCIAPDELELYFRRRYTYYAKQHKGLLQSVDSRWRYVLVHGIANNADTKDNPLVFLFHQGEDPEGWLGYLTHKMGQVLGFGLGSILSATFVHNTWRLLQEYIPYFPLQVTVALYLSSSSIYPNIKILAKGVSDAFDVLFDILTLQPIHSLIYRLRPKTVLALLGLIVGLSVYSYGLLDTVFQAEFPLPSLVREIFRYVTDGSIDFYHVAGMFHTFVLFFSLLTPDQRAQFLFAVEEVIKQLNSMNVDEFQAYVETHPEVGLFDVRPYPAFEMEKSQEAAEAGLQINAEVAEAVEEITAEEVEEDEDIEKGLGEDNPKSSWCGSWCSWWSSKDTKAEKPTRGHDDKQPSPRKPGLGAAFT